MLSRGFLDDFFQEQNTFMRKMRRHFDKELQSMSEMITEDDKLPKGLDTERFVSKEVHSKTILDKNGNIADTKVGSSLEIKKELEIMLEAAKKIKLN